MAVKEEEVCGINGHKVGGTETLDGFRDCEEANGNDFCDEDDIMVAIWGSDVYMDGVCTRVCEDGEENPNDEGQNLNNGGLIQLLEDSGVNFKPSSTVLVEDKEIKQENAADGGNCDIPIDDSMDWEVEKQMVDEDLQNGGQEIASLAPGERICRAATRIAGSLSVPKYSIMEESSSVEDWLSWVLSAAKNPLPEHNLSQTLISFIFEFRNFVVPDQHLTDTAVGGKRKTMSGSSTGFSGTFEFYEDTNDTYWTDMVVENEHSKEQQPSSKQEQLQIVLVEPKPVQKTRRPYRRRHSENNGHVKAPTNPTEHVDDDSPSELVMIFHGTDPFPSEMRLNKTFKYFGSIRESQTEVDRENRRARVVFRKCSEAKIACDSSGIFGIFGPVAVSYKVNLAISEPFKIYPTENSLTQQDLQFQTPSQT